MDAPVKVDAELLRAAENQGAFEGFSEVEVRFITAREKARWKENVRPRAERNFGVAKRILGGKLG